MAKRLHLGFKETQAKIAKKQGVSTKAAGAILASSARKASPKAVKKNPALLNVKRGVKKFGDGGPTTAAKDPRKPGERRPLTAAELTAMQKQNPYLKKAIVKKYKTSAPEGYNFGKTSMDSVAAANMGMPLQHFNVVKKKGIIQGTRKGTSTGDPMDIMRNGGKVTKYGDGGLQKAKGQYLKAKGQSIKAKGQYIKAKGLEIKAKGQNMKPEVPKSIYKQSYSVSSPVKDSPQDKMYEKKQVLNKGSKTIVNRKSFLKMAEGYKTPMYKSTTVYDKKTGATKKSASKLK